MRLSCYPNQNNETQSLAFIFMLILWHHGTMNFTKLSLILTVYVKNDYIFVYLAMQQLQIFVIKFSHIFTIKMNGYDGNQNTAVPLFPIIFMHICLLLMYICNTSNSPNQLMYEYLFIFVRYIWKYTVLWNV